MHTNRIQGVATSRQDNTFKLKPLSQGLVLAHAALLGFAICAPLQASAAEQQDAVQLAPMVITGVAQQSPIKVVTDPRIPRQPVPASDAADYLKTIPGFSAVRSGGVNSDPVFRGMFGSRLKLLTNGGEMLGACPNRMDSPSSYVSPETYDKLTVIKGPQSVLWGPGASAATVLFEREPENFEEPDYRVNGSVLVGSNNRFDRSIDAAAGSREGYARVIANGSTADDYNDGDGNRVPSSWDKWNTDLILGWTPTDDTLLELTAGTGDGESRYAARSMDGTQFERESLALRFKQTNLTDTWKALEAQVYYNYADHVMDNYKLRTPNPNDVMSMMRTPYASAVDRRTLGTRVSGTWQWDAVEIIAGVDAQKNEHRARKGTGDSYKQMPWAKDAEFKQYGLFSELSWNMADGERLISGVRVDRASATDTRAELCNMMGMACRDNPTADKERNKTLPSGFVRYEHDMQSLPATTYIGLGHSQRFPDYWELFSATSIAGQPTAFASINPEKTTQVDFGIQYSRGAAELWASGYVGQVRDYIMFSFKPGMNPLHTVSEVDNIDARIMGGELGGSHRFAPHWKADLSLAYAYGKNSSDGRAMPQIPPLEARFGLSYEQGDWSSSALWRVVAAQNRIDDRDRGRGNVVGKDFGPSSGFGVFSVNSAYRLSQHWKVSAGVDNLFDKNYSEHLNLAGNAGFGYTDTTTRVNESGRTWWTRVDMSF
ncbi:MAG: TonB-dependent copper receptor [Pseudomonas sp.]|nr:TonB-dependent copper receptor [Pseudomonas sp.]